MEAIFNIFILKFALLIIAFGILIFIKKKFAEEYIRDKSDCHDQFGYADYST